MCSVVDNMLSLFLKSWPGQNQEIIFFNLAEKLQNGIENEKIIIAVVNL